MTADPRQRGLALVLVLWALTLLALMSAGFLSETRTETLATRYRIEAAEAEVLADAGFEWAVWRLRRDLASGAGTTDEAGELDGSPLPLDGRAVAWRFGPGAVWLAVQDEAGKLDLNASDPGILAALLRVLGLDAEPAARLAQHIADFRDPDDLVRPHGAEADAYVRLGLAYAPKNAPFERVSELRQIPGLDAELMAKLRPHVTVATGRPGADVRVATAAVLRAITGLDAVAVADIVSRRAEPAAPAPTLPPGALASISTRTEFTILARGETEAGAVFVRRARVSLNALDPSRAYRLFDWGQAVSGEFIAPSADAVGRPAAGQS